MPDVHDILADRFAAAITAAFGDAHVNVDPLINPSTNPRFGDYQANVAMSLAKTLGQKPRDVAQAVVDQLDAGDLCGKIEIAGPGFINLTLHKAFLDDQLREMAEVKPDPQDDDPKPIPVYRLGVAYVDPRQTVVVDYSGPNVAKEMHVGHLRSTVIGDAIARVLEFQGHRVIRQNHLGDWGTQFGMLIEHLIESVPQDQLDAGSLQISDLNTFYQESKQKFDADAAFATRARQRVVALQGGDEQTQRLWRVLFNQSLQHFDHAYERLGVRLTHDDVRGESSYNPLLTNVVENLNEAGLLRESQSAKVVYPDGFQDRDGQPMAMIVQKSDGGYLYATTDLAAARYRIDELGADRIIYVTDARQSQHFAMVFATLRQVAWAPPPAPGRFARFVFRGAVGSRAVWDGAGPGAQAVQDARRRDR